MKRISILLTMVAWLGLGAGFSQDCNLRAYVGADAGVSVLGVILGNYPHYGEAGLAAAEASWKEKPASWEQVFALKLLQRQRDPNASVMTYPLLASNSEHSELLLDTARQAQAYYYEGVLHLVHGNYDTAVERFNTAESKGVIPSDCKLVDYRLMAQYLAAFGDEVPIFTGFNNGFFNFACDSLRLRRNNPDPVIYERLLNSTLDLAILTQRQPAYLEMLGDLTTQYPEKITANWFSSIAYYRLTFQVPTVADKFETKAMYALEAPRTAKDRFDKYQFTKLGRRLEEDIETANLAQVAYAEEEAAAVNGGEDLQNVLEKEFGKAASKLVWLRTDEPGALPSVIREADRREAEAAGQERKFAGNVDLKKIKGEQKFNFYAIIMIVVVIGAVVFIWRQLAKNAKTRE